MSREHLCAYGNCEEKDTPISVNYHGEERPRFCCPEHAALWLLSRGSIGGSRNTQYMAIEPSILKLCEYRR